MYNETKPCVQTQALSVVYSLSNSRYFLTKRKHTLIHSQKKTPLLSSPNKLWLLFTLKSTPFDLSASANTTYNILRYWLYEQLFFECIESPLSFFTLTKYNWSNEPKVKWEKNVRSEEETGEENFLLGTHAITECVLKRSRSKTKGGTDLNMLCCIVLCCLLVLFRCTLNRVRIFESMTIDEN